MTPYATCISSLMRLCPVKLLGQLVRTRLIWQMLADSGLTETLADGTNRYTDPGATAEIELLLSLSAPSILGTFHSF